MVSKVIISPSEVRGLGNIVAETSVDDYDCYMSSVSFSDDVFTMILRSETVTVTVTAQYVKSGSTVNVTVTVLDVNGNPVSGASVELFKEVN
jgi:protocatechuate 3,4-dioxygenase beta subunit